MIADIYDLSPIQAGMLFHRLYAPESAAYFSQFSCELTGRVDAAHLARAWQQLVDRHDVLRTSFHWEGLDAPVQVVHRQAPLPWAVEDWRGLPAGEQSVRWEARLAADRAAGFAPDQPPLMRCLLVRLDEERYAFCWSHHHLLLDGWCLTLVLSEVFGRYAASIAGTSPALPPVRPYREYIQWLKRRDTETVIGYWRERLHDFSATTPLPMREDAPPAASATGHVTAERRLSESLTTRLRERAARQRLTLNTFVQGAWALLLSRYSGEEDVLFGTTVSGRPGNLPGVETMLGVFINTVPVRIRVDPDAMAAAWLAALQLEHVQRESFATLPLAEIQKCSGVAPGTSLFESNLIVMNYRLDEDAVRGGAGLEVRHVRTFDHADTPLTLQATPGPELLLELAYDGARFEPAMIARMLGHVEQVLEEFVTDLERPLAAIEILTAAERAEILTTFNATDAPLDPARTVVHAWEEQAAATPDAIAVQFEEVTLTFAELNQRANRFARGLLALAPLGPDDIVALAFERSDWMVVAMLAVWKCGAAYLPIDPSYPDDRIRTIFEDARPRIVLRELGHIGPVLEAATSAHTRFASVADVAGASRHENAGDLRRPTAGHHLAYVIFTSGSTGRPKGAMVEHLGLMNHLIAKIEGFGLDAKSVVVQSASHCFDISVWQFLAGMLAGGRVAIYGSDLVLDPDVFLARLESDHATVVEAVPSYLSVLLDRLDERPRRLGDLQFLLVTGEMVKPSLVARWLASYPAIPAVNAYGPTEAADDVTQAFLREPPAMATVPVGRPLRNFRIYIVSDRLNLCPVGIKGEICVSGAGVGRGYLNDPARTAAAFLEDPFRAERGARMYRTGDVGSCLADGTILMFGRRDAQVKVRGYRIELGDIEVALAALDGVREAAVVERRDRAEGSYLAGYVTLREGSELEGRALLERLTAALPEYMIPQTCSVLLDMPLTPNGKIDRKALPAPGAAMRARGGEYAAPRTPIESLLAGIWRDALGIAEPGIHDNFFALGGDSIVSMQVASRASRAGVPLTPRHVFEHQTIAALAAIAATLKPAARPAPSRPAGPAPLTPVQAQFFADVTVDRDHYNQSILLEVPADFDAGRFAQAWSLVVQRHEALRLRFTQAEGRWTQHAADVEAAVTLSDAASADELQRSLSISSGPLVRAGLLRDQSGVRLLLVVHHLAMDGVSWRILLEDLEESYEALGRGQEPSLPGATTSYLEWADTLAAATPDELARDLEYWTQLPLAGIVPLPTEYDAVPALNTVESAIEIDVVFDETTTSELLTQAAGAHKTGVTELLLAATGQAFGETFGCRRLLIDLETHGREHGYAGVDLARSVGWFTATFPIVVDLDAGNERSALVRSVKEHLRAVPNRGLTYGLLRQQVAAVTGVSPLAAAPRPDVLFNYHGRTDEAAGSRWRVSFAPQGPPRSPRQQREYPFEVNALVTASRLRVAVAFSSHLHSEATAHALVRRLREAIQALVVDARAGRPRRWTPSDVPGASLSQASLDALTAVMPDAEDIYGLSPTQQGMLFHALYEPASQAYFNQLTCTLAGAIDVDAFRDAWRQVIDRHPVLRTSFHWRELEQPVQVVHGRVESPWLVEDWTMRPAGEQNAAWQRQLADDRSRPFDLVTPPLMRFALCRIAADGFRFCWSQHHLLFDGWSSSIVLRDVLEAYTALTGGHAPTPSTPPVYREAIVWLARQDRDSAEAFWRRELEGFTSPTPLVLGAPELEGRRGPECVEEVELTLPADMSTVLRSFCANQQITLNTLFQGLWSLLLSRYSGDADVVFGAIVSGRPPLLDGAEQMVGLFINTVPVRARPDEAMALGEWLRRLQRDNAEREVYSFSSLADVQRWSQVEAGTPLFETIVIFEHYPVAESLRQDEGPFRIENVQPIEPNNYPLTFVVTPGAQIALKLMYDAGRFDGATLERALGHVRVLLDGVVEGPDRPIGTLPLLTAGEQETILTSWNQTATAVPAGTVVDLFESRAASHPDDVAVICEGRTLTYAGLNARANQLAGLLRGRGLEEHEPRVALLLRRSERLLESVLALWKCGAVYIPIDPDYPAERVATIVRNARASLVVTDVEALGVEQRDAVAALAPVMVLDDVEEARRLQPAADPRLGLPVDRLAYTIYTSGSTGTPKGAMVEHVGMLNHVLSMAGDLGLDSSSIVAQTASHCFDISIWQLVAALVAGGTTAIYPERMVVRPLALARALESDGVTAVQFVPSYLNVFMDALARESDRPAFAGLGHMVTIGEALTHASVVRWFGLYPHVPLMNAYGPTEAADSIAHHDMARPPVGSVVPIGRPIQNMRLYVLDRAMRPCPIGVKGDVYVAGVGVGRGYLFDEQRTAEVFSEDRFSGGPGGRMYRTGDVGSFTADGTLLYFGRRDFQVKIRGHRIELGEIESCLALHEKVALAAVVVKAAEGGGQFLCAYVTPREGEELPEAEVTAHLAALLPRHAVPDVVRCVAAMPVLSNGKIDRQTLTRRPVDRAVLDAPAPPATATEARLVGLWRDVLQRDAVGIDQSFFDLGGHSLKAIDMVGRIGRDLGVEIGIADLFEHNTVRSLARLIDASPSSRFELIPRLPDREDYAASSTQQRLWLASRTAEGSAALNMAGAFHLDGPVDVAALRQAFAALVERHESLRTVFRLAGGVLRQRVMAPATLEDILVVSDWRTGPAAPEDLADRLLHQAAVPFDLERGPLVRTHLARVAETRWVLLVWMHHLVGDAASIRILLDEAASLYAAFSTAAASALPSLPIQYRDFAAWENARAAADGAGTSRDYWRKRLQPELPRTGFARRADSGARQFEADVAESNIDATMTARLREVASRHGTTLFGVTVSAVAALLYRHTAHRDMVIGTQVSRRGHPQLEGQIGCYIDTLVLRGEVGAADTARDLVARSGRVVREALAHQDYPFDRLLDDLEVAVDPDRTPLFDVLLNYVPAAPRPGRIDAAGVAISDLSLAGEAAQYDTTFMLTEADDGTTVALKVVFGARHFDTGTAARVRDQLMQVLSWIGEDGMASIEAIDLLPRPAVKRRRLHIELNAE